MTMTPNEKKTILKKLHHTTKLELWEKVTDLQAKRIEAEDRAKELEHRVNVLETDKESIKEEWNLQVQQNRKLEAQIEGLGRDCSHQDQVMKDLQQQLTTTKENAQRREKHLEGELAKYEKWWQRGSDRVRQLEKLLVHNGKAIGALSDLAGQKFKNDDLPF